MIAGSSWLFRIVAGYIASCDRGIMAVTDDTVENALAQLIESGNSKIAFVDKDKPFNANKKLKQIAIYGKGGIGSRQRLHISAELVPFAGYKVMQLDAIRKRFYEIRFGRIIPTVLRIAGKIVRPRLIMKDLTAFTARGRTRAGRGVRGTGSSPP